MYQIFLTTFFAKIWICKKSDCSRKIWKRQKTSSKKTFNEKSILIISQSPPPLSVGWKCYLISVLHIPNLNLNWPSQHLLKVKNCCIVDLLWTSFVLTKQVNLLLISTQAGLLNPNQWKGGQPARYKRCFSLLLSKWVFSAQNMLTKWLNHTWTILYIEVIQCFSFKNDNNNVKRASSNKTLRRHIRCPKSRPRWMACPSTSSVKVSGRRRVAWLRSVGWSTQGWTLSQRRRWGEEEGRE